MERKMTTIRKTLSLSETSTLYTMMPMALQRRLPRIPSIHRLLLYRGRSISMSSPDLRQELVPFTQSDRDFSGPNVDDGGDFSRPISADSVESAGSSASSIYGQNSVTPVPESDVVTVSNYESNSGLGWNRVVPAFNILRSAGCEAQQPRPDSQLIRSLYINGLTYLLDALPPDLTKEEAKAIRNHLPEQLHSELSSGRDQRPFNPFVTRGTSEQPSYIHKVLSTVIIYGFLLAQLLLPYVKALLRSMYQYERSHRITERLVAATLEVADDLANNGISSDSTAVSLRQGKIAAAVSGVTSWWIEGIAGGIYEGVGEGMIIISGQPPQNPGQRSK